MITVHHLLVRRRVLAASQARRAPKVAPPPTPPRGAVVAYTTAIADAGGRMDREIRAVLAHELGVRFDGLPVLPSARHRIVAALTERLLEIATAHLWVTAVDAVGRQVTTWSGQQLARQVQGVVGIDPGMLGPDLVPQLRAFRARQLGLIKTLAEDKVRKVGAILARHGVGGRVEAIARDIAAEVDTTPARAAVIARSQVLAFNAEVTQARHVAAGITSYEWSTSRDARVRASHRALEGRVFEYAHPPSPDGEPVNPGEAPNCRCLALPILSVSGA